MGSNPQDQNPGLNSKNAEYIRGKPTWLHWRSGYLSPFHALGP